MERLKVYRERAGLTQQQLADALGVARTTVTMWETSPNMPTVRILPKLAHVLGVTVDELLEVKGMEDGK